MKALLVTAAAVGLLASTPAFASAGAPATASANADAEIVAPISVSLNGGGLNFGRIAPDVNATTVTVDNNNVRSSLASNVLVPGGSAPHAALFDVNGASGLAYTASLASPTTTISGAGPAMTVHLTLYAGSGTIAATSPGDQFKVGGTLDVGPAATQTAGAYTGSFGVSVQYN